jgi:hypothetical protein
MVDEMTQTTRKKKPDAVEQVARLLCEMWDDSWYLGKKFHTANAKEIISLIEKLRRKSK